MAPGIVEPSAAVPRAVIDTVWAPKARLSSRTLTLNCTAGWLAGMITSAGIATNPPPLVPSCTRSNPLDTGDRVTVATAAGLTTLSLTLVSDSVSVSATVSSSRMLMGAETVAKPGAEAWIVAARVPVV